MELEAISLSKEDNNLILYHMIDYPVSAKKISKNIIRVQLADDIMFHWDNNTCRIKEDKYFQNIVDHFQERKEYLAALFLDTTPSPAVVCGYDSNLIIGDLVFLLLDKIVDIPYFYVFHFQFGCFFNNCFYPLGLFNALKKIE